jgi:hypothetical protein
MQLAAGLSNWPCLAVVECANQNQMVANGNRDERTTKSLERIDKFWTRIIIVTKSRVRQKATRPRTPLLREYTRELAMTDLREGCLSVL